MSVVDDDRPDLDVRLLRAFMAVAEERHFGRAAERLGLAQPALSRRIQQLERSLGVSLFDRRPQGAVLTAVGRAIVGDTERALAQNHQMMRTAQAYAAHGARTITVAAPLPSPSGGLLAEAIRRDRAADPAVRIRVVDIEDGEQSAAISAGLVDVAFTWGGTLSEDVVVRALVDEPWVAVVPGDSPAASATQLHLVDLAGEPLLFPVRERGHCWSRLQAAAQVASVELTAVPTAPGAVADLVADGLGTSVMPGSVRLGGHPGLGFVAMPEPGMKGRMSVMWRRDEVDPAILAFVAAGTAAAQALSAAHPDLWTALC